MASRIFARSFHASAAARKEVAAASVTGKLDQLRLNFAIPHRALVNNKECVLCRCSADAPRRCRCRCAP